MSVEVFGLRLVHTEVHTKQMGFLPIWFHLLYQLVPLHSHMYVINMSQCSIINKKFGSGLTKRFLLNHMINLSPRGLCMKGRVCNPMPGLVDPRAPEYASVYLAFSLPV